MPAMHCKTVAGSSLVLVICSALAEAQQDTPADAKSSSGRSDRAAVSIIFDEQHAEESALDVHRRAMAMPADERFAFLCDWVLPNEDHTSFRVHADFTPTYPAPPQRGRAEEGARAAGGGEIVSPALDLVRTAASLGRLEDLKRRIAAIATPDAKDQVAGSALMALVDLACGEIDSAAMHLESMFAAVPADLSTFGSARDGLLLGVDQSAQHPKTSRIVLDPAYRVVSDYLEVYDREPWHRQFSAAFARAREADALETEGAALSPPTQSLQWLAASRPLARRRGLGCPPAAWKIDPGHVENLASHDDDYLYFPVPLRGDFEAEGDVTGFGWRDSHLLVAGKWVAPVYDHASYDVGNLRGAEGRIAFSPKLTKTVETIHYRTRVRDGLATTWFNGRKIHEEPLPPDHDPWLAIRSTARHDGGVRNLRITGDPHIPESLRLSDSPGLTGWVPYYGDSVATGMQDWWQHVGPEGIFEIRGRRRWDLPAGSHQENLFVYHRPMFEDGRMEYEFWYEPGRFEAHPALDRLCFLLDEKGVKVHWVTDGRFDRTGIAPDNYVEEPDNGRHWGALPLSSGQWNQVRLAVVGDMASLSLNGELIYRRRLEETNQRTFGLFHYSDRSELRVRNLVWTGNWPRQLPELSAQPLAVDETGFLEKRLPELKASFVHDFSAEGLPPERFSVTQGDLAQHFSIEADGVHIQRPAVEGYRSVTLTPSLAVGGDFDLTATFDQFLPDARDGGDSSIMLQALAGNQAGDEGLLYRRRSLADGSDRQQVQCVRVRQVNGQSRRQYFAQRPVEAMSGTLRLARRGDRLYYLFAENDSQQFRLLGDESFPQDDLAMNGVRLIAQIHGENGSARVVWKSLAIRAEKLSGPAAEDHQRLLADLNAQRSKLAKSFAHDFARTAPDDAAFSRWTDLRLWKAQDGGLLIVAPGADDWTSAGAALRKELGGDFDVSIAFDAQRLDTPAAGQGSSVYLQLELDDPNATQLSMILNKTSEGATESLLQVRVPDGKGGYYYPRLGRLSVPSATGLRLARRGRRLFAVVTADQKQLVVAQADISDEPVKPGGTRMLVHTGGSSRQSRVLFKNLEVRAERIASDAVPRASSPSVPASVPAPRTPARPQPKSFLQSVFDFFSK